jgi:hypothetical protein
VRFFVWLLILYCNRATHILQMEEKNRVRDIEVNSFADSFFWANILAY